MLERMLLGDVAAVPHTVHRRDGKLVYEHCLTRAGFDGPYTISYHRNPPQALQAADIAHGYRLPQAAPARRLDRRHYQTADLEIPGPSVDTRLPLLFNDDLTLYAVSPTEADPVWYANGDADHLVFIRAGGATLRTPLGEIVAEKGDYVFVPRGLPHRWFPSGEPQRWLDMVFRGGVGLPPDWRNEVGQLRMDAPLSHRDFRRPTLTDWDDGVRQLLVRRGDAFHGFAWEHSPMDVVGWDGTVYPWAFPISRFQPRVASSHLPPTAHGNFLAQGALVCSFVPRVVDFGEGAIPCPYPHSSVDIDEVLLYVDGDFTSRSGVGPGSLSHHPAGVPHGPQPGRYEESIGTTRTNEMAVMLDCTRPLKATTVAVEIEEGTYPRSF